MTDEPLVLGELETDDVAELEDRLHDEQIIVVSGYRDRQDSLRLTAVTTERVLGYRSTGPQILGETQTFIDIDLDDITEIQIREQEGFDEIEFQTHHGSKRFMVASQTGVAVAGEVRKLVDVHDD